MDGFFNIFKPAGWTSFDVVAALRRPLNQKRLGHGGTLDPTATGVLPVAAGYATRLLEYLLDSDKEYIADIELGRSTDTYDSAGAEVSRGDWQGVTLHDVQHHLEAFKGPILQTPPAYSAIKVAGVPSYKRVRRGESVLMKTREVTVHELELLAFEPPIVKLRVVCSKGTYMRSLANDLGEALGCGALLMDLVRSRVGPFRVEHAVSVDELRAAAASGAGWSFMLAPDIVLRAMNAAVLSPRSEGELRQGRTIRLYPGAPRSLGRQLPLGQRSRAYNVRGTLFGILEYAGPPALWKPAKVFSGGENPPK